MDNAMIDSRLSHCTQLETFLKDSKEIINH